MRIDGLDVQRFGPWADVIPAGYSAGLSIYHPGPAGQENLFATLPQILQDVDGVAFRDVFVVRADRLAGESLGAGPGGLSSAGYQFAASGVGRCETGQPPQLRAAHQRLDASATLERLASLIGTRQALCQTLRQQGRHGREYLNCSSRRDELRRQLEQQRKQLRRPATANAMDRVGTSLPRCAVSPGGSGERPVGERAASGSV